MNETKIVPRGIRNNNPLNIRKGNNWQGERPVQTDKAFEQFVSMEFGLRAGFILLRNYITGRGGKTAKFDTIEMIISRWAPECENNTRTYIDVVCKNTGIHSRERIAFTDRKKMVAIVRAMAYVECGQWIDEKVVESAYDLV